MEERRNRGIIVNHFTSGDVEATVWANSAPDAGGLVLRVKLTRIDSTRDGSTQYRSTFRLEDLEDMARASMKADAWIKQHGEALPLTTKSGQERKLVLAKHSKR